MRKEKALAGDLLRLLAGADTAIFSFFLIDICHILMRIRNLARRTSCDIRVFYYFYESNHPWCL